MSNCKILFKYCQEDIIIQCQRNEFMRDIINQYGKQSGLSVDKLYFLYNDNKINMDITLGEVNGKDKEILILVYPNETGENETKKLNFKKPTKCSETLTKNPIKSNEIMLKIKIEQTELNKTIYFLDNTSEITNPDGYYENGKNVMHNHDNLNELNENNTTLIIDGKIIIFKKSFIPTRSGIYSIKLIFNIKLSDCAYMFCNCGNIIDIDFSKFNTENVTDMKYMFCYCSKLKLLNLSSFNTQNVTCMVDMFNNCSSLILLNLSSFNTQNVDIMKSMFYGCSSLVSLNLSSFNTKKVNNMKSMFYGCSSLISLNLSSFNTKNVNDMRGMFNGCSCLTSINLSSFNTKNVTNMWGMFDGCFSLTTLNLSSFNTNKALIYNMFGKCINLSSCNSSDKKIVAAFQNKK